MDEKFNILKVQTEKYLNFIIAKLADFDARLEKLEPKKPTKKEKK